MMQPAGLGDWKRLGQASLAKKIKPPWLCLQNLLFSESSTDAFSNSRKNPSVNLILDFQCFENFSVSWGLPFVLYSMTLAVAIPI